MAEKLIIFDTTLRDGEQSPGASMNADEKLRLAVQLEKLGVDIIEAGFPAASNGDFEAVSRIAGTLKKAGVAGLARANKHDISAAWEAVRSAVKPRIHVFLATSDIHLEHKLRMSREEVLATIKDMVAFAKSLAPNVEFSAEDGSRSDRDFLCQAFGTAIAAGASTVNLPDTVGYAVPDEFAELVRYVRKNTPSIEKAVLSVHCHNDLGMATANTLAAVKAGARQAELTVNGIGERAGNTSLEEVVMAIKTRQSSFPVETGIVIEEIARTSTLVQKITGIRVQPNKAIVGANAFAHEAGIHQAGMLRNSMTYEIMSPESIGFSRSTLVIGKHSGSNAIDNRLKTLGYSLTQDQLAIVMQEFKSLADRKKIIYDDDMEAIVAEHILRQKEVYELLKLDVVAGNCRQPLAHVEMRINEEVVEDRSVGIGPVDAVYNAINKIVGNNIILQRFTINALTGGTDAFGTVTAKIERFGYVAHGNGSDPDIMVAAAKAFINAINKIEFKLNK